MQLVVSQFENSSVYSNLCKLPEMQKTAQSYREFSKLHRYAFKVFVINLPLVLHQGQAIHYTLLSHQSPSKTATAPQTYPRREAVTSHLN